MVIGVAPEVLSARRRTALRLDLEDRQATLILELYCVSLRQCSPAGEGGLLPAWRLELVAPRQDAAPATGDGPLLVSMHPKLEQLYQVNKALARLTTTDNYGVCAVCGDAIEFELLAGDPVRTFCDACQR